MSATATAQPKPWDTDEYIHIVHARYEAGTLIVGFGDGAIARVEVTRLNRVQARGPDWDKLTFDDFMVTVPTREGDFEIPWFPIRSMTDPAFRAHLDAVEAESARWVGQRVRELREGRGLTVEALAARAGLAPSLLSRLEEGDHDGDLRELQRVVESMGHRMKDLHRPAVDSPVVAAGTV